MSEHSAENDVPPFQVRRCRAHRLQVGCWMLRRLIPSGTYVFHSAHLSQADAITAAVGTRVTPPEEGRTPIIHETGCGWETGPYCTCGADPERIEEN